MRNLHLLDPDDELIGILAINLCKIEFILHGQIEYVNYTYIYEFLVGRPNSCNKSCKVKIILHGQIDM